MAPFVDDVANMSETTRQNGNAMKAPNAQPYTNGNKGAEYTNGTNGAEHTHETNGQNSQNGHAEPFIAAELKDLPADLSRKASDGAQFHHRAETFRPHSSLPGGPQAKSQAKVRTYTDDPDRQQFPRISRPVELMREAYDVVVIGSGYGGGVAASRMARGEQSVCLLERGKEKWPGEYPSDLVESLKDLHVSGDFSPGSLGSLSVDGGDPTGLYHLILGQGQNAFVGNGLGGTSLLNANVFLEADEDTLKMKEWPPEIRNDEDSLKKYYRRAADVLQPTEYPRDWPDLPKLSLLEKQSEALGLHEHFRRVTQTTRFVDGPNSTGVEMNASALTGQDCTGVNDGSKSSTLVNYLSDAWNWGAEMFCECEVRYIKPHPSGEGYLVFYAWHGGNRGAFKQNFYEDLMWVHARKCLFLGAGALGTTEILLRSQQFGLNMSNKVGTGMSGNGDILAFGYDTDDQANAIGNDFPSPYNPIGPTINGIIDCRTGNNDPLDGFVIEEGAVPQALAPILQFMIEHLSGKLYKSDQGLLQRVRHLLARQGSRFLGPYFKKGSIEKTQIYLIMSHDSNQAVLTLKDDKPSLRFLGVGRSEHVLQLNNILAQATAAVGGTFVGSPFYAMGQQEITVHPIGGACMASDGTGRTGVTNHCGEVFTGMGKKTHRGLIITDGAVIPTALGANPFATITALAERSVEYAASKLHIKISHEPNDTLDFFKAPKHPYRGEEDDKAMIKASQIVKSATELDSPGFGFSEVMKGFIHTGGSYIHSAEMEDYKIATKTARSLCQAARFFLSVKAWDLSAMLHKPDHTSMLTGTFVCAGLRGSPFMVHRGDFHLFNQDLRTPGTRNLAYEFDMTSINGERVHFQGFKLLNSSVALNPLKFWQASSTLYVTLKKIDATGVEGEIIGRGTLNIQPSDFGAELSTLSPSTLAPTGQSIWRKARSIASFLTYFTKQSAGLFFTPLIGLQYPSPTYKGFITNTEINFTHTVEASDHVKTMLQQYEPRQPHPSGKIPIILMIPGASVDHQIFATPTIKHHSVDYFTDAGYRVYVITTRIGKTMAAEHNYTTFDARLDIKAALAHIREHENRPVDEEKIYVIAHCMGSVAFASGLLDGTIPATWIKGITASQVFMNPEWATLNLVKANTPIALDKIYNAFAGHWYSCNSSPDDSFFQRAINQVLRFYPVAPGELCNSVTCHRTSFTFGRLWNHHNLNDNTHRQLSRFFGGVNMTLLSLIEKMGTIGHVTSNAPLCLNLVNPANLRRLKGIKMLLFSGADNRTLTPESTDTSYSILRDMYGSANYERVVFEGYGHLDTWMGRRAYKDVWPRLLEHIDKVYLGEDFVSEMVHDPSNPDGGFVRVPEHHDHHDH